MKSPYIGTLVPNDVVTAQFLVISKEIRQKRSGEPYLALHLADRTGEIEAKMWDNVPEVMNTFDRDDFVKVKGLLQIYQNRSQFTVHRLRRLEEHEIDFGDYFPCSDREPEEMFAELQGIIANLGNPHLRALLEAVFEDPRLVTLYKIAPAAKNIHHACRGGLLEHVLSVCTLCRMAASHYKDVDLDLLLTGAILHDIGKIEELSYSRSFGYSAEGQLLGHIVIGLRIIGSKLDQLPDFPPKLRTLLEHILISHHGELEFGSPKVPIFPEALLFHHLDNLDSKMDAMRNALKRDRFAEGDFTGWISSLERILLKKERFLLDEGPPLQAAPETEPRPLAIPIETAPPQDGTQSSPQQSHPSGAQVNQAASPDHKTQQKPAPMTLFGEKLQAVLDSRK
jgi:3'-5' exoribonuclease